MSCIVLQKINQKFVTLLGSNQYSLNLIDHGFWCLDIMRINGDKLISGLPLLEHTNLLEMYGYLNFGCKLYSVIDDDNITLYTITG